LPKRNQGAKLYQWNDTEEEEDKKMKDYESILSKLSVSEIKNSLRTARNSLIRSINDVKNNCYTSEGRRGSKKFP
jgi:hypothetical protein